MATYSTGITATWGSVTFGEVQELSWTYGGSAPRGRDSNWTDDAGTVDIGCLSSTGISTANYGSTATLTITGGGANISCRALYQGCGASPELNGVTRYTVSLKILAD